LTTKEGAPCPTCNDGVTQNRAMLLLRFGDSTEEVLPHQYAVCAKCHDRQYEEFYKEDGKRWELAFRKFKETSI
jgi:hypothetical protein